MAKIKSPMLFFVTSPRTPSKMCPEIGLLVKEFSGQKWTSNTALQADFMRRLSQLPEFEGAYNQNDPALSARDRITRGPKALGFVNLDKIALTAAGKNFLDEDLFEEALLRQLLKFQLPSPFHEKNSEMSRIFCVRPYLEILRLINTLGRMAFDELCLYGMQLTDWHDFEKIVEDVRLFRKEKEKNKGRYKKFFQQRKSQIISEVYKHEIYAGQIKTRESAKISIDNFIETKSNNMRDYADACLRYLRATGLVTVSNPGRTISIIESRRNEVEYILKTVCRDPVFTTDKEAYCKHLYDANSPVLLTDNRDALEKKALHYAAMLDADDITTMSSTELKKHIKYSQEAHRKSIVDAQITELKTFSKYEDVIECYKEIKSKSVYDLPLTLEWNAWRTMTMMDGGDIRANLSFDDAGNPLSTAPGKTPDIICDYGDFIVTVEVTLMSGAKQYEAEGEPVARHLGEIKLKTGKSAYCLFVAPTINENVISHFYGLHRISIKRYGGTSVIIPLTLERFIGMLTQAKNAGYIPSPDKIREFCEYSKTIANNVKDEDEWYSAISQKAENWLV